MRRLALVPEEARREVCKRAGAELKVAEDLLDPRVGEDEPLLPQHTERPAVRGLPGQRRLVRHAGLTVDPPVFHASPITSKLLMTRTDFSTVLSPRHCGAAFLRILSVESVEPVEHEGIVAGGPPFHAVAWRACRPTLPA